MKRRGLLVYGALLAIWLVLLGWQAAEHLQVRRLARAGLRHRAEDISNTLAIIMRSQRFFVSRERIETVLNELVKQGEIHSIKLLNIAGDEVATAGDPITDLPKGELTGEAYWNEQAKTVTLMNLVDLGTNIILSASEFPTNRPPGGPPPGGSPDGPPPRPEEASSTNGALPAVARADFDKGLTGTNRYNGSNGANGPFRRFYGRGSPRFSDEEIKKMIQSKSAHGFIMVLSANLLDVMVQRDLWMRLIIAVLGAIAALGCALAWRNLAKTSELQIRLVRASELNSHLKEMNLAAAGLAHETRNPLNIVRGLAQMISKQSDASPEIRLKTREIIDETDRVAAQLNEFINYSRPREVRLAAVPLHSVVGEVVRALNYDIEEKKVVLKNLTGEFLVDADEQLLRQALFNLVLNAIQAVAPQGEIEIRTGRAANAEAYIEIADNGPGVPVGQRVEIFKPYVTTHEEGTGLGLAVVQQIILAHGWEIQCLENAPKGALFRITHLKLSVKG